MSNSSVDATADEIPDPGQGEVLPCLSLNEGPQFQCGIQRKFRFTAYMSLDRQKVVT